MSNLSLDFLTSDSRTKYPDERELNERQTIGAIERMGLIVHPSGTGYRVVSHDETECIITSDIFELQGLLYKLRRVFLRRAIK